MSDWRSRFTLLDQELLDLHFLVISEGLEKLRNIQDSSICFSKIKHFKSKLLLKVIVLVLVTEKSE
jgi:hypothetical protein